MPADGLILLSSKNLYKKIYRVFSCHKPVEAIRQDSFRVEHLAVHLMNIKRGPEIMDGVGERSLTPAIFLDDNYQQIKAMSGDTVRTIWLNSEGHFSPDVIPVHDAELMTIEALPENLNLDKKPSLMQCYSWLDEWDVPENVRRHSTQVAWGAYVLAVMMQHRGIAVDPILTHRGGLLHDLDKIATLGQQGGHGVLGGDFLFNKGYSDIADIVRGHIMHRILEPHADERSWEEKLVFFVDKLVEGDEVVPFNQRLAALKERYPDYREIMEQAESGIWGLSEQICSQLSFPSHLQLISALRNSQ